MLAQAGLFILNTAFGLLSGLLLLRFFMQAFRAPFHNQLGAFVLQTTNWLIAPLRRVLPGMFGLDLASVLTAYLLQTLLVFTIFLLAPFGLMNPGGIVGIVLWTALLATLRICIHLLIGTLIAQAILSWVRPHSPLMPVASQLTRPFTAPIQRLVPPVANIDLSPLIAIVLAQLVLIFLG